MADEVLDPREVKDLLYAIESVNEESSSSPDKLPLVSAQGARKTTLYDFRRPERVGKEQMRAIQSMHESFGRTFAASVSTFLRTLVEVKLNSVDQLTYGEFVYDLENPSFINLIRAEPLNSFLVLDISPSVIFPILDRLLGGRDTPLIARRPLTGLEQQLARRFTDLFLRDLTEGWSNVLALNMRVERVESNPQIVNIVPPNEVAIVIVFELIVGESKGMLSLCIPYNAIEHYATNLTDNSWQGYSASNSNETTRKALRTQMSHSTLRMSVTLAETKITTAEMLGLRVGDVITTDTDVNEPLQVFIEGVPKFLAKPGALKGRKAIQLLGKIMTDPPADTSAEKKVDAAPHTPHGPGDKQQQAAGKH